MSLGSDGSMFVFEIQGGAHLTRPLMLAPGIAPPGPTLIAALRAAAAADCDELDDAAELTEAARAARNGSGGNHGTAAFAPVRGADTPARYVRVCVCVCVCVCVLQYNAYTVFCLVRPLQGMCVCLCIVRRQLSNAHQAIALVLCTEVWGIHLSSRESEADMLRMFVFVCACVCVQRSAPRRW